MTDDDERMDRARRIREMREGSRPQDEASNDDQQPNDASDEAGSAGASDAYPAGDAGEQSADRTGAEPDQDETTADVAGAGETEDAPVSDETDDTAGADVVDDAPNLTDADAPDPAATADDDGTIHIPGADVDDVDVDVGEMAREAGLHSVEPDDESESDDEAAAPAAPGAVGRAEEVESDAAEETRVLEFTLGTEQYCLDIEYVEEIVKQESVTRVPNTPDCVEGVVDLRGQITTILDPKVLLDISDAGSKDLIIVFDPEEFDDQGAVGWVVDDVNQVTPITEDEVNPSPVDQDHVNGVVDRDGEFVIWTTPELDLDEVVG